MQTPLLPLPAEPLRLNLNGRLLEAQGTAVMGVLNVTPDSFSDGGRFDSVPRALAQAREMAAAGVHILDVGGESTRPGASAVGAAEELDRVIPVIEGIAAELPTPISIDTSKPQVMRAAVAAGAGLINDVRALREEDALQTAADLGVPVCLMHMLGEPRTMQIDPRYDDVVAEVRSFLSDRLQSCEAAGIRRDRVLVDPGFGFGKTVEHNLILLRRLHELGELGCPVLAGLSRKSMIGKITGAEVHARVAASVALAVLAAQAGARLIRAHDVAETLQALRIHDAWRYGWQPS